MIATSALVTKGVVSVAVLSARLGSKVAALTTAVLAMLPAGWEAAMVAVIVTELEPPTESAPSGQLRTRPACEHAGVVAVTTTPLGRVSDRTTPVAFDGPALETCTVQVIGEPAVAGLGVAVFVTEMSAMASTGVIAVVVLLDGSGSAVVLVTDAEF